MRVMANNSEIVFTSVLQFPFKVFWLRNIISNLPQKLRAAARQSSVV